MSKWGYAAVAVCIAILMYDAWLLFTGISSILAPTGAGIYIVGQWTKQLMSTSVVGLVPWFIIGREYKKKNTRLTGSANMIGFLAVGFPLIYFLLLFGLAIVTAIYWSFTG